MSMARQPDGDHVEGGLHYLDSYRFIFQSPNWVNNLLLGSVCQLIPVIGPIVLFGYEFEVVEALHRNPDRTYPDFDFNRFVIYLQRGIWPMLIAMCVGLVLLPIMMLIMIVPIFLVLAGADKIGDVAVFLIVPIMAIVFLVLMYGMLMLLTPMILRAGLAQEFAAAFDFAFVKDFIKRVWWEELLSISFLMISSNVMMLAGSALFCVGMYPAVSWAQLAQSHLWYELYELYLERGGTPIPLKEPTMARVEVVR